MSDTHNGCDSNFEEIEIPVPWGHISGKWWGSRDRQPVLAIHGWQDNAGTFDPLAALLAARGHSLLCIDLPGHGRSSHYAPGHFYYVFWDGVHIVRRIVKHFGWQKVTILGHSLGGAIAFLYASSFPLDVDRYISLDIVSPSVRDPLKMVASLQDCVDKFLKYETLRDDQQPCYEYDEMLKIVQVAYGKSVSKEGCKVMVKRGMRESKDQPGKYVFSRDPRLKVSALAFMTPDQVLIFAKQIKCKVMNIRGNPGITFDFPEFYNEVLDTIEQTAEVVERHVVEGEHHLHLNDAQSIVDIVDNFLKS